MADGDKIVSYTDQIIADLRTDVQTLDTAVDEMATDVAAMLAILNQLEIDNEGLVTVADAHHHIHESELFTVHVNDLTFQNGGEIGILLTTPDTVDLLHMTAVVAVDAKSMFDILEAPTIDAGNYPAQFTTPINRQRNSAEVATVWSVRAVPVINEVSILLDGDTTPVSADGLAIHHEVIGGGKNKGFGEGVRSRAEHVLMADTTYYFRIKGDGTGSNNLGVSMELNWYAHELP